VTEQEARVLAEELAKTHPDRETHRFVPRKEGDGDWMVAKINLPPVRDELSAETRADERPPTADDPRDGFNRNVPGYQG
jgi:hypothetical protein